MNSSILDYLERGFVAPALKLIKADVQEENYDVQRRYDDLVMLCQQCLAYHDEEMMERLTSMVFELVDDILEGKEVRSHRKYEYILRANSLVSEELLNVKLRQEYDSSIIDAEMDDNLIALFRQVWLSGKSSAGVVESLRLFLHDSDPFLSKLVTYALMLRLVRYYDHAFVNLLMEQNTPVSFAALAVVLICQQRRIASDKRESRFFADFCKDEQNCAKLTMALESFVMTNETRLIADDFERKVFPEVMRKRKDLHIDQMLDEGKSPDWEGMLEGSSLIDKMRKINDLQLSGKDVNYATFKAMKHYPFFSETSHWFFPFTYKYRDLGDMKGVDENSMDALAKAANVCDSDRYSLFLMFKSMGVGDMSSALGNIGLAKLDDLKDMVGEKWQQNADVRFRLELRFAVMNLFRFYNLAPNHSDFSSPFNTELKDICKILPANMLYRMANAAFDAKDFNNAVTLFEASADSMIDHDVTIYDKMAKCYFVDNQMDKAVDLFDKANILDPDNVDVLRGLAECYAWMEDLAMQVKVRKRIEQIAPEDTSNLCVLSNCLRRCGLYDEALARLYKCEYKKSGYEPLMNIAEILFLSGKYEEAANYFDKACEHEEAWADAFFKAAVNGIMLDGCRCATLMRHCYEIVNDVEKFITLPDTLPDIREMMDKLDDVKQMNLTNIINKTVIDL